MGTNQSGTNRASRRHPGTVNAPALPSIRNLSAASPYHPHGSRLPSPATGSVAPTTADSVPSTATRNRLPQANAAPLRRGAHRRGTRRGRIRSPTAAGFLLRLQGRHARHRADYARRPRYVPQPHRSPSKPPRGSLAAPAWPSECAALPVGSYRVVTHRVQSFLMIQRRWPEPGSSLPAYGTHALKPLGSQPSFAITLAVRHGRSTQLDKTDLGVAPSGMQFIPIRK